MIDTETVRSAAESLMRRMFEAAVASAQPAICVPKYLPAAPRGRLVVVGAGKAAAAMARAVEESMPGTLSGMVVTRDRYVKSCDRIEVVEAEHPVPDDRSETAARHILDMVSGLAIDDLVLCLISGGGSSLLSLPAPGLTLAHKQVIGRELLKSGATISEINCVRRHLSAIKGGRLAAASHPARVVTLAISDVPGDKLADIASGPTVFDSSTCADAREILCRYGIHAPNVVLDLLDSGLGETIKPGDLRLQRAEAHVVATPQMAMEAAACVARGAGYGAHILSDALEGEARHVGTVLAGIARQVAERSQPFTPPCVLLSGGETTVTVHGQGRGGRNVECLLAMTIALAGHPRIYAIAADTDGIDGREEIAGAMAFPNTLTRAAILGLNSRASLVANDAHRFFGSVGTSLITGPTFTNVNDFRAILIN